MLSLIKGKLMYIVGGIGLCLLAALYFSYEEIKEQEKEIAKYEVAVESLKANQEKLRKDQKEYIYKYLEVVKENTKLTEEVKDKTSLLESYKEREDVVKKAPKTIERRANAATKRVFREFECATGKHESCTGSEAKASKTSPGN